MALEMSIDAATSLLELLSQDVNLGRLSQDAIISTNNLVYLVICKLNQEFNAVRVAFNIPAEESTGMIGVGCFRAGHRSPQGTRERLAQIARPVRGFIFSRRRGARYLLP
jgi:hypothetical protein